MGNPKTSTTFSPEIAERICAAVQNHHYIETAAALCNLPSSTVRDWLRKGRAGQEPFADFAVQFARAEAVSEGRLLKVVADAAEDDPKQALALLERRHRDRWSRTDPLAAVHGDSKVTIQLVWPGMNVIDSESSLELNPATVDAEVIEDAEASGTEL